MVILGLGSNLGDRLMHLRNALARLKQLPHTKICQVSPVYISDALLPPRGAPSAWERPYLNCAIRCDTQLAPLDLLQKTKQIEIDCGRTPEKKWGPRAVDIDILAWDDWIQYDEALHVPHEHLLVRPFALWPLADVAPRWACPLPGEHQGQTASTLALQYGLRFSGKAKYRTRQIPQRIDGPQWAGILNLTPDSFSDGGQYTDVNDVLARAKALCEQGADILDMGAEATGPTAQPIGPDIEWARLAPALEALLAVRSTWDLPPKISIDTRHVEVAERALRLGADWINDVSGLTSDHMRAFLAGQTCDVVFMHHLTVPEDRNQQLKAHADPVQTIYAWAEKKLSLLEKQQFKRERLVFDPGIGYGKSAEHSLETLQAIDCFKSLGTKLLVGHSRKSFLSQFTDRPPAERDLESVVVSLHLAQKGVDYLRVHDVGAHARALKVHSALGSTPPQYEKTQTPPRDRLAGQIVLP